MIELLGRITNIFDPASSAIVKTNTLLKSSEMIPNVQVLSLETINDSLKLLTGKLGVAADATLLTKRMAQRLGMGGLGILNLFPINWDCPYVGWPWGNPIARWPDAIMPTARNVVNT